MPLRIVKSLVLAAAALTARASAEPVHFVDELPLPPVIRVGPLDPQVVHIELDAFKTKIHRDLPELTVFGYDGSSPGPTFDVERGMQLEVHWHNALPTTHVFPVPMDADQITPDVRAVTHLHGADVAQTSTTDKVHDNDGWPDAWTVNGEEQIAVYPNVQSARSLWYHDHAMGATGRNVAAGLTGAYFIRDAAERALNLPRGAFEVPLILAARQVNDDGSVAYTANIGNEYYGNAAMVNGKLWPFLHVEPRRYRFRFINAANARSFALKLDAGPAFYQIGADAGLLPAPVLLNDPSDMTAPRLLLQPAERADVIIDFSAFAGKQLTLSNDDVDTEDGTTEAPVAEIMQVRVDLPLSGPDTSAAVPALPPVPRPDPATVVATRRITFGQMAMGDGGAMLLLNGKHWQDPITETPKAGTTEVWELTNPLDDTHPFHVHGVTFQVLDRRMFDVPTYLANGEIVWLNPPAPPLAVELGWKDTVKVLPHMMTRILVQVGPNAGYFVYHCHILEHEDMDMMRPFQILP